MEYLNKDNAKIGMRVKFLGTDQEGNILNVRQSDADPTLFVFDIDWDINSPVKFGYNTMRTPPSKKQGYVFNIDWIIVSNAKACAEAPCNVCSKMNDIGVNSCWNCGNKP